MLLYHSQHPHCLSVVLLQWEQKNLVSPRLSTANLMLLLKNYIIHPQGLFCYDPLLIHLSEVD